MFKYIGNINSLIVHIAGCECSLQIHPDNIEFFETLLDALSQNYNECNYCLGNNFKERKKRWKLFERYQIEAKRKLIDKGCIICGNKKVVQKAHIIPKRYGGIKTMPLCPTCHWKYDHKLLKKTEINRVKNYIENFDEQKHLAKIRS